MGPIRLITLLIVLTTRRLIASPVAEPQQESKKILGTATNVITTALLRGQTEAATNFVFAPLGFASILAMLGEGSRGSTAEEIRQALMLPEDFEEVRAAFGPVLKQLLEANPQEAPQFKTWFYVYDNYTARKDFRNLLAERYHVEVRTIKRNDYDFDNPKSNKDSAAMPANSKDIVELYDLQTSKPDEKGEVQGFDKLKREIEAAEKIEQKECSKLDQKIDEGQFVDTDTAKNEMPSAAEELEMMLAEAYRTRRRIRSLSNDVDSTTALSGNSLVGKKEGTDEDQKVYESKMLLFNGLYFRGNWATPFQRLRSESTQEQIFYNASEHPQKIDMMRTRGVYKTGQIAALDSQAVEIPYENPRYSLLVVLPNSKGGVRSIIKQFTLNTIPQILENLKATPIHLTLPKFQVDHTGRAEKALAKSGITSLFTTKADLSGITDDQSLHVDELVQHVSIRVDEGAVSQSFISATNTIAQTRTDPIEEEFVVNRPFLFFVRDVIDDIIVIGGKVCHLSAEKDNFFEQRAFPRFKLF